MKAHPNRRTLEARAVREGASGEVTRVDAAIEHRGRKLLPRMQRIGNDGRTRESVASEGSGPDMVEDAAVAGNGSR